MMTSRERVIAALNFANPDRVPRDVWALPYMSLFRQTEVDALLAEFPADIGRPELSPGTGVDDLSHLARTGTYTDDWGSVWEVGEPGIIGEVKQPAITEWSQLATYRPPLDLIRGRDLDQVNRSCDASELFMLSGVSARPFERLQFIRGTENVFMDLAYGTRELNDLLAMLHEFYLEDVRWWAQSHVDAVFLMDDWGTNRALLISPDTWRSVFKPLYRDYCKLIHDAGKYVFFHSDGHTREIYGDLIEIGVDAINSQLFCMDIEELGRQYRGQVTFWGEIDRQHVLPFGDPAAVAAAVRRVRRAVDTGHGGVIAQCEWGKDCSQANVATVFRTWLEASS